eukprot:gene37626-50802_t
MKAVPPSAGVNRIRFSGSEVCTSLSAARQRHPGDGQTLGAWAGKGKGGALRQSVVDRIIIALLGNEDMHLQSGVGRFVDRPHRDGGPVAMQRLPEQRRAAPRAKAAADLFRRCEPGEQLLPVDRDGCLGHVGRGKEMAGLLAALSAMARVGRGQRRRDGEGDAATQAGTAMHDRPRPVARATDRRRRFMCRDTGRRNAPLRSPVPNLPPLPARQEIAPQRRATRSPDVPTALGSSQCRRSPLSRCPGPRCMPAMAGSG